LILWALGVFIGIDVGKLRGVRRTGVSQVASGVMTPFCSASGFNEKDGPVGGAKLRVVSSLIGMSAAGIRQHRPLASLPGRNTCFLG